MGSKQVEDWKTSSTDRVQYLKISIKAVKLYNLFNLPYVSVVVYFCLVSDLSNKQAKKCIIKSKKKFWHIFLTKSQ